MYFIIPVPVPPDKVIVSSLNFISGLIGSAETRAENSVIGVTAGKITDKINSSAAAAVIFVRLKPIEIPPVLLSQINSSQAYKNNMR